MVESILFTFSSESLEFDKSEKSFRITNFRISFKYDELLKKENDLLNTLYK